MSELQDASAYVTRDGSVTTVDHRSMLADLTGTRSDGWFESEGPDSRCGVDYYYQHDAPGMDARINDDQGLLQITVMDSDGYEVAEASIDISEAD